MTMNNKKEDAKGEQSAPRKLQLTKTVETGHVQQTFARGKSKTVTVEVKKTRTFSRSDSGEMVADRNKIAAESPAEETAKKSQQLFPNLTEEERETRLKALEKAKTEDKSSYSHLPPISAFAQERQEKKAAEEKAAKKEKAQPAFKPTKEKAADASEADGEIFKKKTELEEIKTSDKKARIKADKRQRGKLTISNALLTDQEDRVRSMASVKRARQKAKRKIEQQLGIKTESEKVIKEIVIPEAITVQDLANRMAVQSRDVIKELMKLGIIANTTHNIDADTAELVVNEFGHKAKRVTDADVEDILKESDVDEAELEPRAPIVTVMGHVDHGKTSLLDALRSTNVTEGEAGGITQHIGAYQVKSPSGQVITFLDTPGHEAFTSMRARGAKVTDIVILVVAADDSIMPQTIEAINHAKAAEVPIIVAINKIDKPGANPMRVKQDLLQHELVSEELGGDVMVVEISAKQRTNLDKLLDAVLLQAEVLELKAVRNQKAVGTVIEARVDKGKGVVATLLVQRGTLNIGDIVVAGSGYGKIKAIYDDKGVSLKEAGPSVPVEVLGLDELPDAGDTFAETENEKQAREITEYRRKKQLDSRVAASALKPGESALDRLFQTAKEGYKELRIIVKGDVQGSIEAICGSIDKLSNDEIKAKVIHSAAGAITESDVTLAAAVGGIIIGFNVRAAGQVRTLAEKEKVDIRYYSIIYNLIDDLKAVISGMLSPIEKEVFIGHAQILQVFKITKSGKVAGCKVTDGVVKRGAGVRLLRDNVVIHQGKLKTLKRFKDEAAEVREGMECGMAFENYEDIREGDIIEAFEIVKEAAKV